MKQIFDQFLQFLQQGIAAIFRFVQLVWTWSMDQITKVTQAPWENWPLWKQILLVIVIAAVAYALFTAAKQLWVAGVHVLAAFASFLGALVVTLPTILIAGCTALAGLWVINNLNLSSLPSLTALQGSNAGSSNDGSYKQASPPTGQGGGETAGSKP
jgi:cytochrome bd-type quinol oxidase subunit 2